MNTDRITDNSVLMRFQIETRTVLGIGLGVIHFIF
jgi:hypothetical protein